MTVRYVKAFGAGVALLVLLAGVPVLLWQLVGNPLPAVRDLLAGDVTDHVVLAVLAVIAGVAAVIAWLQFTAAFLVEFTSGIRRAPIPARLPGVFAGQQHLARALVTAVLLLGPTVLSAVGPTLTAAAAAAPHATPTTVTAAADTTAAAPAGAVPAWPAAASTPVAPPAAVATEQITTEQITTEQITTAQITIESSGPRSWWDLAEVHLGSGDKWRTLWDLNAGAQQTDGTVLTSSNTVLRTGWLITIPSATPTAAPTAGMTAGSETAATQDVIVAPGDTLSALARAHDTQWTAVWELNRDRAEPGGERLTDPDHIEPGWTVTVPDSDAAAEPADAAVTVRPGDTLSGIATDHHTTTDWLWVSNEGTAQPGGQRLTDPDYIEPGWTVRVPAAAPNAFERPADSGPDIPTPAPPAQSDTPAPDLTDHGGAPEAPAADADRPPGDAAPPQPTEPTPETAAPQSATPQTAAPETAAVPESAQPPPATSSSAASSATGEAVPGAVLPSTGGPSSPSPTAPTTSGGQSTSSQPAAAGDASSVVSMVAAGGGAVVLTALALMALQRARRRQFRLRRPGRSIAATPPEVGRMERLLLTAGRRGFADVNWLDQAMRSLVQTLSLTRDAQLPDVMAVRMGAREIDLILASPLSSAPAPWRVDAGGSRWSVRRGDALPYDESTRDAHIPPFPLLVSVGYTPDGDHYLLDLERIGSVTLAGDPDRCMDLARYLAAEIAHNQWSELLQVTLVGFGKEMAELNPAQLTHVPELAGVAASVRAHLAGVRDVMADTGVDVAAGRLHNVAGDTWAPHVVLISPDAAAGHHDELTGLLEELQQDRQTVAVVLTDSAGQPTSVDLTRWWLTVDSEGVLSVPALDLQLIAEQLPAAEAAPLTQLLVAAADADDQPMPAAQGTQAWDEFSDAAGNLRPEMTTTAAAPVLKVAGTWPGRTNSILPLSPAVYAAAAATTEEDVLALSPGVGDDVRQRLAASDPTLDEDLAAWWDGDSPRVKLRLLGPVDVWSATLDPAPPGRPQKVEAVAYLATRTRGASAARAREDLWPDDRNDKPTSKVRNLMLGARNWLGINPATGREHLPPNAGEDRGGLYVAEGILVDAELFRRLRLRAMTSGPAGITDLRAALDLVTGVPFEAHRPRGYGWIADLVAHYTGMVADAAHIVATHHLAAGEPEPAAAAAQVALLAGSTADNVLLDLVAACHARGDEHAGNSYVQLIVDNHGEVEEDIPARTYEILLRHGWLPKRTA
jgi:LysM repeat protein